MATLRSYSGLMLMPQPCKRRWLPRTSQAATLGPTSVRQTAMQLRVSTGHTWAGDDWEWIDVGIQTDELIRSSVFQSSYDEGRCHRVHKCRCGQVWIRDVTLL